jgi:hypothetical protein
MKKLILDHFHRWWWVLALGAAYALVLGWSVAIPSDSGDLWHGGKNFLLAWLKVQSYMFAFQVFMLASWTGAILLLFDLQRGITRAVTVLPLTARQIGRSWWLATVAIPAVALATLFFLGAGTFCIFHPDKVFPSARLAMASLFTLLWLGMGFTIYSNQFISKQGGNWRQGIYNFFITALALWMMFGFGLSTNAPKNPVKLAIFLGAGTLLTIVGWFRAGQFSPPRPKQAGVLRRPGLWLTPLSPGISPVPDGRGGIPFLISATFYKTFLICVAAGGWWSLVMAWQGQIKSCHEAIETIDGMGSIFWVIIFVFLMPVVRQLRYLRTLPISATNLAAVIFSIATLPLIALGALVAGVAGLAWETPLAFTVLKSYALILAPVSVCIFFAVWRGTGIQAYLLLLFTMIGFQQVPLWLQVFFHYPEIPFSLIGPIVVMCVLSAFLLTRRALLHSNHAYRVQATSFGNLPWGADR